MKARLFCLGLLGFLLGGCYRDRAFDKVDIYPGSMPMPYALPGVGLADRPQLLIRRPLGGNHNGRAVLVLPGGGYSWHQMMYEGELVARWLSTNGYTAAVLLYRLPNDTLHIDQGQRHWVPLTDAIYGMRALKRASAQYHFDSNQVGVMGFSAGAHLAAQLGNLFHRAPAPHANLGARPAFVVMGYPVVTMLRPYANDASRSELLGPSPSPELDTLMSQEYQVGRYTPPTFLWGWVADNVVPWENAMAYEHALLRARIPHEIHGHMEGAHGGGASMLKPNGGLWKQLFVNWMEGQQVLQRITPSRLAPVSLPEDTTPPQARTVQADN